jgi:flagellar basal-body rod protein FlgG
MTYGLWLSTAGLQINEYRQSVMANNLANADTVGFKHDLAVIQERRVQSESEPADGEYAHRLLDNLTGGAFVRPTIHTFEQGDLEASSNPFDLAIYGEGFFSVSDGQDVRYTRDGRFMVNKDQELVMVAGNGRHRVLDDSGAPIRLPELGGRKLSISGRGAIYADNEEIARIGLVGFDDPSQLSKVGGGLYQHDGLQARPGTGVIKSKYLEKSTFNPIDGLAKMIEVSRAYELNARMISLQDFTIGQAVSTVGRIG